MIPPIPDSKFFEKLTDGQDAAFKELQDGYEAEVKVYRFFEELKRDVIVIHQLSYTHQQYFSLFPDHACSKKKCKNGPEVHPCHQPDENVDGETDFVVIGPYFVAVFEVKGLTVSKYQTCCSELISKCSVRRNGIELSVQERNAVKFEGCCEDAARQRNRMVNLVKHLNSSIDVYQFTIFPNISIDEVDKGYLLDKTLLFSEDIEYTFISWFDKNIPRIPVSNDFDFDIQSIKRCLLGLWCINQDNEWNLSKCSFSKCVLDVDEKLIRAVVTRQAMDESKRATLSKKGKKKRKEYPENKEIVQAPDLFRKYLNIDCLTQGQMDLFDCEEKLVWVDGAAGCGKTITMLAKIIHLALNTPEEERILLLMIGSDKTPAVQKNFEILNNIGGGIDCEMVLHETEFTVFNELQSSRAYLEKLSNSRSKIVLVVIQPAVQWPIPDHLIAHFSHVFVDDYQLFAINIYMGPNGTLSWYILSALRRVSASASLWIFCDDGQSNYNAHESSSDERPHSFSSLSVNLSKTYDCAINANTYNPALNETMGAWKIFHCNGKISVYISDLIRFRQFELIVNMRNTYEISTVLSITRKHYDEVSLRLKVLKNDGKDEESVETHRLTPQTGGHFLRGEKPIIYLIEGIKPEIVGNVLENELNLLFCPGSSLTDKDIAVVSCGHELNIAKNVLERWNSGRNSGKNIAIDNLLDDNNSDDNDIEIAMQNLDNCISAEWPAVIFVHRHSHGNKSGDWSSCSQTIPQIYSALSRARVYCSIIIHSYRPDNCDYLEELLTELRKNTDVCRVVDIVDSDIDDSDIVDSDIVDSDIVDSDIDDSDIVDSDIVDSDIDDSDIVDSDIVDSDIVDSDIVDSDIDDSDMDDSNMDEK